MDPFLKTAGLPARSMSFAGVALDVSEQMVRIWLARLAAGTRSGYLGMTPRSDPGPGAGRVMTDG
jgi:hypothetical protein